MIDISNLSENELLQLEKQIETKLDSLSSAEVVESLTDLDSLIDRCEHFNKICGIGMKMDLRKHSTEEKVLLEIIDTEDNEVLFNHYADLSDFKDLIDLIDLVNRHTQYTSLYHIIEDLTDFKIICFRKDRIVIDFSYKNVNFSIVDEANEISISARINLGHGTANYVFVVGDFTLDVMNPEESHLVFELNRRTTIYNINQIDLVLDRLCEDMFEKIESLGYYQK